MKNNMVITSFTGFRFIMIMIIFVSHLDFLENLQPFSIYYSSYLHNPTMAVDFFFMLSGFGMMYGNLIRVPTGKLKLPSFYDCFSYGVNHIKKIYPLYLVTIIFGLVIQIILAIYELKCTVMFVCKQVIKLLLDICLMQSLTGISAFTAAYNAVGWFLSTLFCIYLISPILIYFFRKFSRSILFDLFFLFINIFLAILLVPVFKKAEVKIQLFQGMYRFDNLVYASPFRRIFYVAIGMNLSMIFYNLKDKFFLTYSKLCASLFEIIICSFSIVYFLIRNILPIGIYKYFIDICLCTLLIFIFAFNNGIISEKLQINYFQVLGDKSKYVFLIHYPIIIYLEMFYKRIYKCTLISCILFIIVILFLTFMFSDICYKKERSSLLDNSTVSS